MRVDDLAIVGAGPAGLAAAREAGGPWTVGYPAGRQRPAGRTVLSPTAEAIQAHGHRPVRPGAHAGAATLRSTGSSQGSLLAELRGLGCSRAGRPGLCDGGGFGTGPLRRRHYRSRRCGLCAALSGLDPARRHHRRWQPEPDQGARDQTGYSRRGRRQRPVAAGRRHQSIARRRDSERVDRGRTSATPSMVALEAAALLPLPFDAGDGLAAASCRRRGSGSIRSHRGRSSGRVFARRGFRRADWRTRQCRPTIHNGTGCRLPRGGQRSRALGRVDSFARLHAPLRALARGLDTAALRRLGDHPSPASSPLATGQLSAGSSWLWRKAAAPP